jgi:crossover junction endodeoxyribonuclease RuvC
VQPARCGGILPGALADRPCTILGIDPGLRITGYGVVDCATGQPKLLDAGVIRLDPRDSIAVRLVELEQELNAILSEHNPTLIAIEQLYAHVKHPRTSIVMAHARGVILLTAAKRHVELVELPANRVKQSLTGFGHAGKDQMQRAIAAIFRLKEPPEPPDVADALAIALCAWQVSREPQLIE